MFSSYLNKINAVLDKALPASADQTFVEESFGSLYKPCAGIQKLMEPNRDLMLSGGKRWRPLFLVLTAEAFLYKQRLEGEQGQKVLEEAYKLTPLVEFVHTASLIHDDIEDHSEERRGKPAAYLTYGLDTALNSASWLYFQAPVCIQQLNLEPQIQHSLYSAYLSELRKLHLGQAMDIHWHSQNTYIPDREEYLVMVKSKTGTLSSLAARCGALVAGADQIQAQQMSSAASKIGAAFQIIDDVINLTTGNVGKRRGDDIVEGKKSLPVILFFEEADEVDKKKLMALFEEAHNTSTENPAVEKSIILLEKYNSIEKARTLGLQLLEESLSEIESIFGSQGSDGQNPALVKIKTLFESISPKKA